MILETKIDNSFSNISIKYDSLLNYFQIWLGKSLGWNFCICNGRYSFLVKQLKLTAMVILTGILWRFIWEKKWLFCCSYNPDKSNIANHFKSICKTLDKINVTHENLVLLGDFNVEPEEKSIAEFLNRYNLKNLAKQNTCFKNPDKLTYIQRWI